MSHRGDSAAPTRRRSPGQRDHYAWWEYALMLFAVALILGGAFLLLRLLTDSSAEPSVEASVSAPATLDCPSNGWYDAAKGACVPKVECEQGTVYEEETNTCGQAPPIITGVGPSDGPPEGGTQLTVTGSGFTQGAQVTINGVPGVDTRVVNDTTIATSTPPSTVYYPVDIVVTNDDGQSDSLDNVFTYTAPPVQNITEIVPSTGSSDGGEAVIIKGQDFLPGAVVSFYGRPATEVEVLNGSTIRAVIPAAPVGPVTVNVRNPGEDAYVLEDGFTYVDQPPRVVMAIRPAEGAAAGGTSVTIAGTGFEDGAVVTIGGKKAKKVTFVDSTRITAVTPPGDLGTADVAVRNPDVPAAILADAYTYVEAPTVTGVTPAEGPQAGGTTITISGTGFLDGATVTVAGTPATKVTVVSDTEITAVTPAGPPGDPVRIVVTNPDQPEFVVKKAFTYTASETSSAADASGRCRPISGQTLVAAPGSDLIITDDNLFPPNALKRPSLVSVTFSGYSGSNADGDISWQSRPARIVWSAPLEPGAGGVVRYTYRAANCSGTGTGSLLVQNG